MKGWIHFYHDGKLIGGRRWCSKIHRKEILDEYLKRFSKSKSPCHYDISFDTVDKLKWKVAVKVFKLNGEFYKAYPRMIDAAKDFGINPCNLSTVKARRNKIYKNYKWKFYEPNGIETETF